MTMKSIIIPTVGESITEVVLAKWLKKKGDYVKSDELIGELESEKATLDLRAEVSGIFHPKVTEGETVKIGDEVGTIDESSSESIITESSDKALTDSNSNLNLANVEPSHFEDKKITPLASKILDTEGINSKDISADGNKLYKQDVLKVLNNINANSEINTNINSESKPEVNSRNERSERLSQLRKVISKRLVEAKNTTAMLTTFNEVDMSEIMNIRKQYKDAFQKNII